MRQCVCDICSKPISTWLDINVCPNGISEYSNVGPLMVYKSKKEICTDCWAKVLIFMKHVHETEKNNG